MHFFRTKLYFFFDCSGEGLEEDLFESKKKRGNFLGWFYFPQRFWHKSNIKFKSETPDIYFKRSTHARGFRQLLFILRHTHLCSHYELPCLNLLLSFLCFFKMKIFLFWSPTAPFFLLRIFGMGSSSPRSPDAVTVLSSLCSESRVAVCIGQVEQRSLSRCPCVGRPRER